MTEQDAAAHEPEEYHPLAEEYLETMMSLSEEGIPVIQANLGSLTFLDESGLIPGVVAEVRARDPKGNLEVTVEGGGGAMQVSRDLSDRLYVGIP